MRRLHRAHALLTVMVLIASFTLYWSGVLSGRAALVMFLAIELPLLLVFIALSVLRFKTARGSSSRERGVLDFLVEEEPMLSGPVTEIRSVLSLVRWMARRRYVPAGSLAFGYAKGSALMPLMMIVASLVEVGVVHLLVPWQWLRIVLFVLTVWAIVFVLGYLSMRATHPHWLRTIG